MIVFPNAKINLGLQVLGKRSDGYHDIETILLPIALFDVLEAVPSSNGSQHKPAASFQNLNDQSGEPGRESHDRVIDTLRLTASGLKLPDDGKANSCYRAYELMRQYARKSGIKLPATNIHLHKNIPSGAGLGGGSADAAFTLKLLADLYSIQASEKALVEMAARLGSDCPFFIHNKPMLATGRGEILKVIHIPCLKELTVVLAMPPIHIDTAEAYRSITPVTGRPSLTALVKKPVEEWKECLVNDFEAVVLPAHPTIKKIKDALYEQGALYASMSGSGSSVYGLFHPQRAYDRGNVLRLKKICANLRVYILSLL